jgi:hypothetical protein
MVVALYADGGYVGEEGTREHVPFSAIALLLEDRSMT